MPKDERDQLLKEIDAIRTDIERLQPRVYEEQERFTAGRESSQAKLLSLRKALARDMELLHTAG